MISQKLQTYIEAKIHPRPELLTEMEEYADKEKVPIMELVGVEVLLQILRIHGPTSILEVGTAIGYSALRMSYALPHTRIVTIERDIERANLAEIYIQRANKQENVLLIRGDALEVEETVKQFGTFDAIFIDAAKGQYQKFFEMYGKYLSDDGIIITDNILFRGLVAEEDLSDESKRIRSLVKKIDHYNSWLMDHPEYETAILPVGDGIAISKKR